MLAQTLAVTWLNLRNVRNRLTSTLVIVTGIGGVVAVLLGLMAMSAGFRAASHATCAPHGRRMANRSRSPPPATGTTKSM